MFLMRNYRADLSKWQTADPLGYPDGWNPLAYCGNRVTGAVDLWDAETITLKIQAAFLAYSPTRSGLHRLIRKKGWNCSERDIWRAKMFFASAG